MRAPSSVPAPRMALRKHLASYRVEGSNMARIAFSKLPLNSDLSSLIRSCERETGNDNNGVLYQ